MLSDRHAEELSDLAKLARLLLIVQETSAPVKRLFSHDGIITRPHRASMSDPTQRSHASQYYIFEVQ